MFRSYVVPFVTLAAVTVGAIFWPEFIDIPSLLLTLGGSLMVTGFSYSRAQLLTLIAMIDSLLLQKQTSLQEHINQLARLTRLHRSEGIKGLEKAEPHLGDPFLRQAVNLLVDLRSEESIHAKLEHEIAAFLSQYELSRQILLTLGKLLPAFGLIGTLLGMVLLLRNFSGQDLNALPAALSLAVLTTLYGAVLANVAVAPLAARLQSVAVEKEMMMRLTAQWLMLLVRGETDAMIARKLTTLSAPEDPSINRERMWHSMALPAQR